MEPLSIIASVLGISKSLTGIAASIRWIISLRNAPLEFMDLQNELQTVLGYLDGSKHILADLSPVLNNSMLLVIYQISICLGALEDEATGMEQFSNSFATDHRSGTKKLGKKMNWKLHQKTIVEYRDRVRRRRVDLVHAVGLIQPTQRDAQPGDTGSVLANITNNFTVTNTLPCS
ncbi:hypothetical protein QBC38DRAFT_222781 [Podospora fimiseda]|uniref:Fungal N-terminal domain-containing protein n=1 Tax=Podospora fimiseda TaxID=252190 RepID=A0AAN7BXZ0_9PEZI|nr:hypothetical protein QBC38DRAFT_222781 [Podospora fimiseda]